MTVVDSSALLAILFVETDAADYADALQAAPTRHVSVANLLETAIGLRRKRGEQAERALDGFVARAGLQPVPVDATQLDLAREAFRRFGRGIAPAGLNFGDCFAYALAKHLNEPLLFKGSDFSRTDITPA